MLNKDRKPTKLRVHRFMTDIRYLFFNQRPSFNQVAGEDLVGVLIGVGNGINAKNICKCLDIKKLYLIDPYMIYEGYDIKKVKNFRLLEQQAQCRLKKESVVFIKKLSKNACNMVPDDLDFVYIDGNHHYDYVKQDINLYYPKIKTGGILGGHEFVDELGVIKAVTEFCHENNLKIHHVSKDWWIRK